MLKCCRWMLKEIGPGYSNNVGAHIHVPLGRGYYGTPESFKAGMKDNIDRMVKEAAARAHLKGYEREALEQEEKMKGRNQSHH